eukprot:GHVS01031028.1.p1 GENE.GHVS01031028.1~~GHVS01031028.1.p1  ORF type:complete len:280 (-),score=17.34 GHVS01031028.1:256-1095(-)
MQQSRDVVISSEFYRVPSSPPLSPSTNKSAPYVHDFTDTYDVEEAHGDVEIYMDDKKLDRILRHGFIRKVYGIVASQFTLTAVVVWLFLCVQPLKIWVMAHGTLLATWSVFGSFVTLCYLICAAGASQSYPSNYVLLCLFTICESVMVGYISAFCDATVVLQAFIATSVLVTSLVVFSLQTTYDFTSWVAVMVYVLLAFIVVGTLKALFWHSETLELLLSGGMALVFCIYLVVDTQLLIGRGKIRLGQDDYILGALMIYLDIINLFIELLRIFGSLWRN